MEVLAGSSVFTDSDTTFRAGLFAYALLVDRQGRKWVGCWDSALEQFVDDGAVPSFTHWWPTSSLCGPGNPTACTNPVARRTPLRGARRSIPAGATGLAWTRRATSS